jgi:DNA repair exonuclease SbcCD ATPase subunit
MRSQPMNKIENRIERLGDSAAKLLEQEEAVAADLATWRDASPSGRLRASRHRRSVARAEAKLERLKTQRTNLVEQELCEIMLALEKQSRRTRDRLDAELERLEPVQAEWERLRSAFAVLGRAVTAPAIEQLAGQWTGDLEIPEFPVRERDGYTRPFPARALTF